jgi:hypothetical protein
MTGSYTTVGVLSDPHTIVLDKPTTLPIGRVRITVEILPTYSFWTGITIDALAKQQGVTPVRSIDDLWGDFCPEEESVDDCIDTIRLWRQEDSRN